MKSNRGEGPPASFSAQKFREYRFPPRIETVRTGSQREFRREAVASRLTNIKNGFRGRCDSVSNNENELPLWPRPAQFGGRPRQFRVPTGRSFTLRPRSFDTSCIHVLSVLSEGFLSEWWSMGKKVAECCLGSISSRSRGVQHLESRRSEPLRSSGTQR